ncbi:MAG: SEC-C domain-containing protein [Elusimicrobiaceae bacterium]|nr:SEC-C domain-containing protein [Elusimicrobiaceae bacterium]
MLFDFLLRRKNKTSKSAGSSKSLSIEERLEEEKKNLPSAIKNMLDKDPSLKDRFVKIAKQMEADGVDMNSASAMRKWAKANQKRIREQEYGTVKPIVKDKEPGRNDPCPCGSGKKYKKCCGANK